MHASSSAVRVLIAGAGSRGAGYARYARSCPDQMQVVGVAEPVRERRELLARDYDIPPENVFESWQAAAQRPRLADAVLICTQDRMHVEPAIAFAGKGYHIMLEKPMAPTAEECRRITTAVEQAGILFAVAHVLRYTRYTRAIKNLLDQGVLGEVVSMQHMEAVGPWHQAHSFVRGHWRNEAESSFMLLAKACHDIDWIRYLMGQRCRRVSSFGSLFHLRAECRPAGAADRCLDCGVEQSCPYSAVKIYLGRVTRGQTGWPVNVLTKDTVNARSILRALRDGPYGRCVYACDNDVVDHQVVSMEFDGGRSAVFTMTAFSDAGRQTRIFGTRGELQGNGKTLEHHDFLSGRRETVEMQQADGSILGGHGGGDQGLMKAFLRAIAENRPELILSSAAETLESHLLTFSAEQARREGRVIDLPA